MLYRPELDGIRALAVLLVITAHLKYGNWQWLSGQQGVTLFFVLSGYLITTLLLQEEQTGAVSLRRFWLRRIFRLFPLYYFVLALYALLIFGTSLGAGRAQQFARALPFQALYLPEIPFFARLDGALPFYHSWSLGIEEKFYVLWPALAFASGWKRYRLALAVVLTVLCVFAGRPAFGYASILVGCIAALLNRDHDLEGRSRPIFTYLGVALALTIHFLLPLYPPLQVAYFVVLAGVLISLRPPTLIKRLLSTPPLVWIGKVSYGIYLIHVLCLNVAGRFTTAPLPNYLLTIAISIASATALYLVIERPLVKYGRSHYGSQASLPAEATTAATGV